MRAAAVVQEITGEGRKRKEGRKEGLGGGAGGTRTDGSGSSALGKYVSRARRVTERLRFVRTQTCVGAGGPDARLDSE